MQTDRFTTRPTYTPAEKLICVLCALLCILVAAIFITALQ